MCGTCGCSGDKSPRLITVERDLMAKNDGYAATNRQRFGDAGILTLNLMSSPGAGKTALLVKTINMLASTIPCAVIEGDQQTSNDADRIRATGAQAVQINTGKGCHLDAHAISLAVADLAPQPGSLLFIENVGNLVCPAGFDLGEAQKIVVLSVTEGEDKPLKYPDMFTAANLVLINKADLLPHLETDLDLIVANARRINPHLDIITVSAKTGAGMDDWLDWIKAAHATLRPAAAAE